MIRNFTQQDVDILQAYLEKGQCNRYWNYLANIGERYAALAPGVSFDDDDDLAPSHHFYWTQYRSGKNSKSEKTERHEFGQSLMKADLAQRKVLLQAGERLAALHLSASHIYLQHRRVFNNFYGWRPMEMLAPFYESANPNINIAQAIWDAFIDMADIFSQEASKSETLSAVALFKSHLFWLSQQDSRALNGKVLDWIELDILPVMMEVAIDDEFDADDRNTESNDLPPDDGLLE